MIGAERRRAMAALVGVQLLFAIQYPAAKTLLEVIPPRHWAVMRAGAAGLIVWGYLLARRLPLPAGRGTYAELAGLALLGVAINQYLFVEGLHRTTPGHSAVINACIPVLVVIVAVVLGRERLSRRRVAGMAITLAGVLSLVGADRLDLSARSVHGDLLTLANATSYALFLVLGKRVLEKVPAVVATACLLSFGAVWLLPVGGPGFPGVVLADVPGTMWALAALIVLGPTVGAYGLNTYALRRVESSVVALFIYMQPVIAASLSIALGYESVTARLVLSTALVFAGLYVALVGPVSRP